MNRISGVQRVLANQDAVPVSATVPVGRMRTADVRRRRRRAAKPLLLLIVLAAVAHAQAPSKTAVVDYRYFPDLATMDGNWAALKAGSDGKVYFGLACHGCNGHLVYYDSKKDRIVDVGDLTTLAGENGLGLGPQSKIHAKFGEGKDGRIYFATHGGWRFDYARFATPEGYPGSHYMAYDPSTGKVQDFGIGPRFEGMNTGAYDPTFNRIYRMTRPRAHFVYYDVATGAKVDKGRINNWDSICRTLGIDDQGNVYGSFGAGRIFKYDPRTDAIRELDAILPVRQKGKSLGRDYDKAETASRVVVWDSETRKFYGVEESASTLFSFDPAAHRGDQVKTLGPMSIAEFASRRDVAYATLSLTIGLDRKLYYAAAGAEFDYVGSKAATASHLITYDLRSGRIEDLGEMRLPELEISQSGKPHSQWFWPVRLHAVSRPALRILLGADERRLPCGRNRRRSHRALLWHEGLVRRI